MQNYKAYGVDLYYRLVDHQIPPDHADKINAMYFVLHETGGETCYDYYVCEENLKAIRTYFMQQGKIDIPYNFIVAHNGDDFLIFEGTGFDHYIENVAFDPTSDAINFNNISFGVALIGNYSDWLPSKSEIQGLTSVYLCLLTFVRFVINYESDGISQWYRDNRQNIQVKMVTHNGANLLNKRQAVSCPSAELNAHVENGNLFNCMRELYQDFWVRYDKDSPGCNRNDISGCTLIDVNKFSDKDCFTGSFGVAAIFYHKAVLFTDVNYEQQADDELDCNWHLWLYLHEALTSNGYDLIPQVSSILDEMIEYKENKPKAPKGPIFVHELNYSGRSWLDKVTKLLQAMSAINVNYFVVTSLEEIAWLLNLRGSDVPFNPVFVAYAIVNHNKLRQVLCKIIFRYYSLHRLFVNQEKVTPIVRKHLRLDDHINPGELCFEVIEYNRFYNELSIIAQTTNDLFLMPMDVNFAIYNIIPEARRKVKTSPIAEMMSIKNPTEVNGMKAAHIDDAIAVCQLMTKLELEIENGIGNWTEQTIADRLHEYKSQRFHYKTDSFETIVAFGANSAIIDHKSTSEEIERVDENAILLLNSGSHYLKGTTDFTRTFHFGAPTDFQKEVYTRTLQGAINLMSFKFPIGTRDSLIGEFIAKKYLFELGLNYRHETTHQIGVFLGSNEAFSNTRIRKKCEEGTVLKPNMFISIDPGYYASNFGIRLENVALVKEVTFLKSDNPPETKYLTFEPFTMIPFEPKLIKTEMLSSKQIKWINEYNKNVRYKIGGHLQKLKMMREFHWLVEKTQPIKEDNCENSASSPHKINLIIAFNILISFIKFK
ncbi:xaa-Pro aminopeptidase 1-like protein [Dinothrombium tinctorium]|uniref:Xaa-Pro aminopeptidase 1-like protein n=1 Tax=Dinothrombium tinctorium TaxID=1965070 RepID=A0A3S3PVN0_9ACAR|nr:xaa-Pro aminopeptidase 1-like protein [Dinothrombium tinctorium]RWS08961.1 xaa-Pro aminopeptidase 1-like protein [Dinothrombium tinctorium]RWS08991.1 xaa-Pro aminopeptidase 1-like protein [Dinothrombium tinctorium]